jgi:hypothetical protein
MEQLMHQTNESSHVAWWDLLGMALTLETQWNEPRETD